MKRIQVLVVLLPTPAIKLFGVLDLRDVLAILPPMETELVAKPQTFASMDLV
jgi:hypothetical protein